MNRHFSLLLLATSASLALSSLPDPIASRPRDPRLEQAARLLRAAPMRFEANQGQLHEAVRFYSRFSEQPVFLTGQEAVLPIDGRTLRLRPKGGARNVAVRGVRPMESRSGHFLGNKPAQWSQSLSHFAAIEYSQVYPGIDLVYRGAGKRLEYDFVVGPGADPNRIRLEFSGADRIWLDKEGALMVKVGDVELRQPKPFIYQNERSNTQTRVDGSYRLLGRNQVGFTLARYDRRKTLVIDPIIAAGTYLGGAGQEVATQVGVDTLRRVWVAGYTTSSAFPLSEAPYKSSRSAGRDAFVAVFDLARSGADSLIFSTYLGGTGDEEVRALATGPGGTAYIAGVTSSSDFPIVNGFQTALSGNNDAFYAQIGVSPAGDSSLIYSTYYGGTGIDVANAIAVRGGRVFVVGSTSSGDLKLQGKPVQASGRGGWDAFIIQFNPAQGGADSVPYSSYLGGNSTDVATGVAIDAAGRVYIGGYTMSDDFPITGAPYQAAYKGNGDLFLTHLDLSRSGLDALSYSTYIGGGDLDQSWAMTMDSAGRLYLAGATLSTDFPVSPGAYQTQYGGAADAFVLRFDTARPRGQEITYATYLGGGSTDTARAIAVDAQGRIQIAGYTFSNDFPTQGPDSQTDIGDGWDAYVAWIDPAAQPAAALVCSSFLGGEGNEAILGLALDAAGNAYATGVTNSRQLGIPGNGFQPALAGFEDVFLVRLKACVAPN